MFHRLVLIVLTLVVVVSVTSLARPAASEKRPEPMTGPSPWLRAPGPPPGKAAGDTTYLLGGPERLDGGFETATGEPDWHGWTHRDATVSGENRWHISDYWAYGLNGHGPGNHALVCTDEELPACSPTDTIGGVASSMFDDIEWAGTVVDPDTSVTVRLTAWMHYDLVDAGWDFLELFVDRNGYHDMLGQWTGSGDNIALDISTVVQPNEYVGEQNDQVRLFWRVWSDGGWDDQDCQSPGHGACQIDDISIHFDESLITFDDFESGSPVNWTPLTFSGVGDFTHLRSGLDDLDPCNQNSSVQVVFIDDGMVVPGAGPTLCEEYCYGPGGYVVNHTGGLLADDPSRDWFIRNEILSPPIAWPEDHDGAQLAFDAYKHELFSNDSPGIFFFWYVRSTDSADPADLELAPWKSRNFVFYGGPEYERFIEPVSDLIVPGARWAQVMLGIDELGWTWGVNGTNGTPAPYFDNVVLKAWDPVGPEILVDARNNFQDGFPEQGVLDAVDLGSNWCRIDSAFDTNYDEVELTVGDSLVANVTPLRKGSILTGPGQLHYVMLCNPLFDAVRPTPPGPGGILRGSVAGFDVRDQWGQLVEGKRAFDLPDTSFFYPGDRLRYYLTAADDLGGDVRLSVWPADTTGVLDFGTGSTYPEFAEIRALPSLMQLTPDTLEHPRILLLDETGGGDSRKLWLEALTELGLVHSVDYDHARVRGTSKWSSLGIGASATAATMAGYRTVLFAGGANGNPSPGGDHDSHDDQLLVDWLDLGGRNLLVTGDGVVSSMNAYPPSALLSRLGVQGSTSDVSRYNGGIKDLRINPLAGNGILPDLEVWQVDGWCPINRYIDGIGASGAGLSLATLDPAGQTGGPYAAAVARLNPILDNRIATLPFDLMPVDAPPAKSAVTPRVRLLEYLLIWFSDSGPGPYTAIPDARQVMLQVEPNPFNPRTTIRFSVDRAQFVRVSVYDLKGRTVRRLWEGNTATIDQSVTWDGRDSSGKAVASGTYILRLETEGAMQTEKVCLIR